MTTPRITYAMWNDNTRRTVFSKANISSWRQLTFSSAPEILEFSSLCSIKGWILSQSTKHYSFIELYFILHQTITRSNYHHHPGSILGRGVMRHGAYQTTSNKQRKRKYKVVQIWPGRFVCKQVTVCPGHIWTTLYVTSPSISQIMNACKRISTPTQIFTSLFLITTFYN